MKKRNDDIDSLFEKKESRFKPIDMDMMNENPKEKSVPKSVSKTIYNRQKAIEDIPLVKKTNKGEEDVFLSNTYNYKSKKTISKTGEKEDIIKSTLEDVDISTEYFK